MRATAVVFLALVLGCSPPSAEQVAEQKKAQAVAAEQGERNGARYAAKEAVKSLLKHPLNAEFESGAEVNLVANRRWRVAGTVTSPNDFGAVLTKTYDVTLSYEGNGYLPLTVALDGRTVYANGAAVAQIAQEEAERKETAAIEEKKIEIETNVKRSAEASRKDKPLYQLRKWSFADGKVVEGKLTSFGAGKIKIESEGVVSEFLSADLIPDDQKFVAENLR